MTRFIPKARGPSKTVRLWLQGLLAGVVLESTLGYAVEAPAPPGGTFSGTVTLRDETLAIRVTAVPLKQVMAELSRQSGAPIRWLTAGGEELISVDFPALPLADALERLLGKKNFLLFYTTAADGLRLTHIWISSGETSQGRPLSEHGAVPEAMTPSLPLGQSLPSHGGDSRLSQTITEARNSLARSGPVTQARRGTAEELMKNAISSPMVHSDNTPQGQDNAATSGLFGGAAPSVPRVPEQCLPKASATHFADVTSEGRADAIAINTRGITVRTSDGRQFLLSQSWTATPYFGQGGTYFADVTGDGRADAIAVTADKLTVRRASIVGFLLTEAWTAVPYSGSRGTYFADVTGDGRADAIAVTETGISVRPSDGSRFLDPETWTTEPSVGSHGTYFADVTGDGRADAIAVTETGISVRPSDGLHFLLARSWTTAPFFGQGGTYFADVTGDGRADAIAVNTDQITVRSSTGAGFLFPQAWTIGPYYGDLSLMCTN